MVSAFEPSELSLVENLVPALDRLLL